MKTNPLARQLKPSTHPLRFTEVFAFRGDFGPSEVVNPKGISYQPELNKLIVSVSPFTFGTGKRVQILHAIGADGSSAWFAPGYYTFRDVESKLVIVPPDAPPRRAGFIAGDIFVGRGPGDEISRLSSRGEIIDDLFADPGTNHSLWGGLTFDTSGRFGGRLVAATRMGNIFLIDCEGRCEQLVDLDLRTEGIAVAPMAFGPLGGQIIVGVEGHTDNDPKAGRVYALDNKGEATWLADIGFAAEDITFVPEAGGTYYQCQLSFDRERENRILSVSSSQFLNRPGMMLVVNEMSGDIWQVAWTRGRYTQSLAGRVPGRWSSQGFRFQGTELEAGCFATRIPDLPNWSEWSVVPGELKSNVSLGSGYDEGANLHIVGIESSNGRALVNSMLATNGMWSGWNRVMPEAVSWHPPAMELHNNVLFLFLVRPDGLLWFKSMFVGGTATPDAPWMVVPDSPISSTRPTSILHNGRLLVCLESSKDSDFFINELESGGRAWRGWQAVPPYKGDKCGLGLASLNGELYVFAIDSMANNIILNVRTVDDVWTGWVHLGPQIHIDSFATCSSEEQVFLFGKEKDSSNLYQRALSNTGTWSHWERIESLSVSDASFAASSFGKTPRLLRVRRQHAQVEVSAPLKNAPLE